MVDRSDGGFVSVPPALQQTLAPFEMLGKRLLAWIGAGLLVVGLFLFSKTVTATMGGVTRSTSGTFWDWAPFWGTIIFFLAVATAVIAYLRDYKWLLVTGMLALVILAFQFHEAFTARVSFPGVDAHPSAYPLWYTWTLLFAGALAIVAASLMRPNPRDNPDNRGVERLIAGLRGRAGSR